MIELTVDGKTPIQSLIRRLDDLFPNEQVLITMVGIKNKWLYLGKEVRTETGYPWKYIKG